MNGALESKGKLIGILANDLKSAVTNRTYRDAILNEQLVLVSPYDPSSGFNVVHAMQRNKLIYALSDAALVINAEKGKGGTWDGAVEQLDKLRLAPVYVRSTGAPSEGLEALQQKGAKPWPNPDSADAFKAILEAGFSKTPGQQPHKQILLDMEPVTTEPEPAQTIRQAPITQHVVLSPAEELFQTVKSLILRIVKIPKSKKEIKAKLGITHSQANEWLQRIVKEGDLEKRGWRGRYMAPQQHIARQTNLFDEEDTPPKTDM